MHTYQLDGNDQLYELDYPSPREQQTQSNVAFLSILAVIFFCLTLLKQSQAIDWSWWWISLPLWIIPAGALLLVIVTLVVTLWHEAVYAIRFKL
ncbi:hypothetical protein EXU85_16195 [Spirosoma sp. KCTC 42546]|uniref:hypothetical protein n=1 Tax=Spirosoma sp. KCTC 42546 TaxID=2520506 RepID=UPI00115725F8|nr:hypothetical protein [Spirosoma sp. KCTC 42546]QDK80065.1 hypothetical protein EXU85_16195 [Spirosoma sp. KCTC 42546]